MSRAHSADAAPRRAGRPALPPLAALAALAVVAVAGALGWFLLAPKLPAPAAAVQRVLELRRSRSSDASAYAAFFADPEIARALASDAATGSGSPIPGWSVPYVSRSASSSADVVVLWHPSASRKGWPKANVFTLQRSGASWRITDATEIATGTPPPPAPAKR